MINGGLSVGTYNATTGTTTVAGAFNPASFANDSGTVSFNGAGALVGTYTFYSLALAGGMLTATGSLTVSNALALTAGTFSPGSGTHLIAGNWNDSGATFTPSVRGTIQLTGAAPTITQGASNYFSSVTIGSSTTASLSSAVAVQGNLSIQGSLNAGATGLPLAATGPTRGLSTREPARSPSTTQVSHRL